MDKCAKQAGPLRINISWQKWIAQQRGLTISFQISHISDRGNKVLRAKIAGRSQQFLNRLSHPRRLRKISPWSVSCSDTTWFARYPTYGVMHWQRGQ